jgi:hypothetical protein
VIRGSTHSLLKRVGQDIFTYRESLTTLKSINAQDMNKYNKITMMQLIQAMGCTSCFSRRIMHRDSKFIAYHIGYYSGGGEARIPCTNIAREKQELWRDFKG